MTPSGRRSAPRTRCSSWTTTRAHAARCASTGAPPTRCTTRGCRRPRAGSARWPRCPSRNAPRQARRGRDEGDDVAKLKLPTPTEALDRVRDTEVWRSVFRPGSIFRRGYRDTSRDRALATMNNVLYPLHPVKMKRHGLKLTYTFCLGGLSFFLFILLTITG